MPGVVAAFLYGLGIWILFRLASDPEEQTSKWLWVPVAWMWLAGSRPISYWVAVLGMRSEGPTPSEELFLQGNALDRNVFSVLMLLAVIALMTRVWPKADYLRENRALVLYFAYCGLSIIWSDYPGIALKRWFRSIGDILMIAVIMTDQAPAVAMKRALARSAFILIPLSIMLIKYYPEIGRYYNQWTFMPSYSGVTWNKNSLGVISLFFGLASWWLALMAWRDRSKPFRLRWLVAHCAMLVMVVWVFHMVDSATSLACFVLAGGVMTATYLPSVARRLRAVYLLVTVAVVLSLCALFWREAGWFLKVVGRDASLTGRVDMWKMILGFSGSSLLGTGYESFWVGERYARLNSLVAANQAHNGYLETYLNLGWIGVVLIGIVIVAGLQNVVQSLGKDPDLGRLKLSYFVAGVIYNFTEAAFKMSTVQWICFLWAVIRVPEVVSPAAGAESEGKGGDAPSHNAWQRNTTPVERAGT